MSTRFVRRSLVAVIALGIALLCGPTAASALDLSASVCGGSTDSAVVKAQENNGSTYLFLPGQADLGDVQLSSPSGSVEVWSYSTRSYVSADGGVDMDDLGMTDSAGELPQSGGILWVRINGVESKLTVMHSSAIRSVFLNTDHSRSYVDSSSDHSATDTGTMTVLAPDSATPVFDGAIDGIRGRGNSTWGGCSKKPYQVKLKKKTELLGNGEKSKTWLLLANAADPTLLRNTISYKLGLYLGSEGTPTCEPCDLYYNGEYRGSYLITEKVKVEKSGVDIDDLDDANEEVNEGADALENPSAYRAWATNKYGDQFSYVDGLVSPENISGGYLVELDARASDEPAMFYAGGHAFVLHTPEVATYDEVKYISELFSEAFAAAQAGGEDSKSGKVMSELFDESTLIATGLAQDFVCDGDYLYSSSYFYVKADSEIVYLGPIWDCDRSFYRGKETSPSAFAREFYSGNPELIQKMGEAYAEKLAPVVNEVLLGDEDAVTEDGSLHSIAYYKAQIARSQQMDEAIWGIAPLEDEWTAYERVDGKAWEQYVDDLSTFSKKRLAYLEDLYKHADWKYCEWKGTSLADWVPYVDGKAVTDGWVYDQGFNYYMSGGRLVTGWVYSGGWYFLDWNTGVMRTGWFYDGTAWYYADARGKMKTGWQFLDGNWYYLAESGAMASGWKLLGNTWYYMDASGAMAIGWRYVGGRWYYLTESGAMKTGWALVDGAWYYLEPSGAMATGWKLLGNTWYYMDASGAMATGWRIVGGTWYYFDDSGAMRTGWALVDGIWYYLEPSGAMATGWKLLGGIWYYMNGSGAMATGWCRVGGRWYYLADSGAMTTGWVLVDDAWYFLNGSGAMSVGWLNLNGIWYFLDSSGAMRSGFIDLGGARYYLTDSGAMATGWAFVDGSWYYFTDSGAMVTGWLKLGNSWYWLDESGVMATGYRQIDGVWYCFDNSGRMVSEGAAPAEMDDQEAVDGQVVA